MIRMSKATLLVSVCTVLLVGAGCEEKKTPTPTPVKSATSAATTSAAAASASATASASLAEKPKTDEAPAGAGVLKYMPKDCPKGRFYINVKGLLADAGDNLAKLQENLSKLAGDEKLQKTLSTLKEGGFEPLTGIQEVAVCADEKDEPLIAFGLDLSQVKEPLALISKAIEESGKPKPTQVEQDGLAILENLMEKEGAVAVVAPNIMVAAKDKAKLMAVAKGGDGAEGFGDAAKQLVYFSGQPDPDTKLNLTIADQAPNLAYNFVAELSGEAAKMIEKPDEAQKQWEKQLADTAKELEESPFKAAAEHLKAVKIKIEDKKIIVAGTMPKSLLGDLIKSGAEAKPEDMQKLMKK